MSLIGYAIFGLVAGAVARLIHPGRDPMNWLWTMLLGVAGATVGGWIGGTLGVGTQSGLMSWIAAIGGSVLLLAAYHALTRSNAATTGTGTGTGSTPTGGGDYKEAVFDDLSKGPR